MDKSAPAQNEITATDDVSAGLRTWGIRSWLSVGIALFTFIILIFLKVISGLFVPLVIAVVMAMLFYPLVDKLVARRVNRSISTLLVMLLVVAVVFATFWLMWVGVVSQADQILTNIEAGLKTLSNQNALPLPDDFATKAMDKLKEALPAIASGITSFFLSGFSGIVSLLMGGYTALFLLYYLLSDWNNISNWVGSNLGEPAELGMKLVADTVSAIRIYFYALTLANLPVAVAVGVTMWLLGLPLAIPVALVTMVTAYIPYVGAIVSTIFAALVALGAGSVSDAVIIVVVIMVLQNVLDPIITNYFASDKLEMHPIVTLVTTLGGGILFGGLGATLASPIVAALIGARKEIQTYHTKQ